jgi:hypothetical protein
MGWVPPSLPKGLHDWPEDKRRRFLEHEIATLRTVQARSTASAWSGIAWVAGTFMVVLAVAILVRVLS